MDGIIADLERSDITNEASGGHKNGEHSRRSTVLDEIPNLEQYKSYEAAQRIDEAREVAQRAKLERHEDLYIEQQIAQQVLAEPLPRNTTRLGVHTRP